MRRTILQSENLESESFYISKVKVPIQKEAKITFNRDLFCLFLVYEQQEWIIENESLM